MNYCIIKETFILNNSWLCSGVPCKIIKIINNTITIKPFNGTKPINISNEIFTKYLEYTNDDDTYVYCNRYPNGKIEKKEFDINKIITREKLLKSFKDADGNFKKLLEKIVQDAYCSKGSNKCCNIKTYTDYKNGKIILSKLENIGDPVFNRSSRHTPPIYKNFTNNDFKKDISYPAPIGITYEDFALPSEQNLVLCKQLEQLLNCKGAPECPEDLIKTLNLKINKNSHICRWCNEKIDISNINQEYCSQEHTINFCHIDPLNGTNSKNIYLGHCKCNREQGGYSEKERIEQVLRLIENNEEYKELYKTKIEKLL